jgi:hypothetical protein
LAHIGALVIPGSISVAGIQTAFDRDTGTITDSNTEEALRGLRRALTTFMKDYACPCYVLESQVRDEPPRNRWSCPSEPAIHLPTTTEEYLSFEFRSA